MSFSADLLLPDITYKLSRSGGKGGQHVNKVSSKAELNFDLENSPLFTPEQKERIFLKLAGRLTAEKRIQVISSEDRSQYKNKQRAAEKLLELLTKALYVAPKRKNTKIPKGVKEARLEDKRRTAMKKISRGRSPL